MSNYPLHPNQSHPPTMTCEIPLEEYESIKRENAELNAENRRLKRALWLARAERYKMSEFIAREEANLYNQISWSRFLRERTYNQWVDQLLRIANLANKLHNKYRAKAEEYK